MSSLTGTTDAITLIYGMRGGQLSRHVIPVAHLAVLEPPCIMCVQYRGGCSVPWRVFSTVGGYHEYRGVVQYRGGIS